MRRWPNSTRAFRRFTRGAGARRSRRSACCGPRRRSFSIRSAWNGSWSNGWSSTFCFAGSSGCRSTRRSSTRRTFSKYSRPLAHTRSRARTSVFGPSACPRWRGLLSAEHFFGRRNAVEGLASMKSFRPKDGSGEPPPPGRNGEADFRKTKRSNETHASTTDKDARLQQERGGSGRASSPIPATCRWRNPQRAVVAAEATWRRERLNARRRAMSERSPKALRTRATTPRPSSGLKAQDRADVVIKGRDR